jgi:hypothetical protein
MKTQIYDFTFYHKTEYERTKLNKSIKIRLIYESIKLYIVALLCVTPDGSILLG